ncbi:MAG: CPBP family intramembrane glutamic endopeptidase [Anaerolineae bacterium]|jgi:membrane protease YdiL (CAAX protease family)
MEISFQPTRTTESITETRPSQRVGLEALIVFTLTIIPSLLWSGFKSVSVFLPIAYLLIERRLRNRPWAELGFDVRGIRSSLAANWFLVLLVALVNQASTVLLAKAFWPAFLTHIESRIPLFDTTQPAALFGMLLFTTLGEEMAFRSLFQERLSWFVKTPIAIVVVSVIFGLMHWSAGDLVVTIVDVALVTLDSIIFGLIFSRGKNLYVAWLAHLLGDVVGIVSLMLV